MTDLIQRLDAIIERLDHIEQRAVSVEFLQKQFDRQTTLFHEMRDEMRVQSAILARVDTTLRTRHWWR